MVFLGELYGLIRNFNQEMPCSCGERVPACQFWGGLDLNGDLEAGYKTIHSRYDTIYPDHVMVDASKRVRALRTVSRISETKVIYLIRDVRAWVTSHRLHGRGTSSLRLFVEWYRRNRKIQKHLEGIPHIRIGYEELTLYPRASLNRIADWLGVHHPATVGLVNDGHRVGGNRMQTNKKKNSDVYYDNRWFYHRCWLLPSLMLPMVMKLNQTVYGNIDSPFS